jgi:repressor LexA
MHPPKINPALKPGVKQPRDAPVELTETQAEVFRCIYEKTLEQGYQPSVRDLCEHYDVTPNALTNHIKALEKKGWIERQGKGRAIRFLNRPDGEPFGGFKDR